MCRVEPSEPVPSPFSIGELLQDSLDIGIKCWKPFLIMGLIVGGFTFVTIFFAYLCTFLSIPLLLLLSKQPDISVGFIVAIVSVVLLVWLVISLVFVWLYGGEVAYSLAIVRGEEPPTAVLFSGMAYFWNILIAGANIVVIQLCAVFFTSLMTGVPALLYIVYCASTHDPSPVDFLVVGMIGILGYIMILIVGVLLGMMFSLTHFFIVDRGQGPVEAMKSSWRFVQTQFWKVLGVYLLIFVCMLVICSVPLVGMFLGIPVAMCLYTVLYLKITGQRHGLTPEIPLLPAGTS